MPSLVLGYGAVLPLPAAAVLSWMLPDPWPTVAIQLGIWWGSSVLLFLAGVRRGLSFRADRPAYVAELVAMLWLFLLGAAALVVPTALQALTLLAIGYASVAVLDPATARRGDAPPYFEQLRPIQMGLALIGLIGLMLHRMAAEVPF
jgi:hypothetical protein